MDNKIINPNRYILLHRVVRLCLVVWALFYILEYGLGLMVAVNDQSVILEQKFVMIRGILLGLMMLWVCRSIGQIQADADNQRVGVVLRSIGLTLIVSAITYIPATIMSANNSEGYLWVEHSITLVIWFLSGVAVWQRRRSVVVVSAWYLTLLFVANTVFGTTLSSLIWYLPAPVILWYCAAVWLRGYHLRRLFIAAGLIAMTALAWYVAGLIRSYDEGGVNSMYTGKLNDDVAISVETANKYQPNIRWDLDETYTFDFEDKLIIEYDSSDGSARVKSTAAFGNLTANIYAMSTYKTDFFFATRENDGSTKLKVVDIPNWLSNTGSPVDLATFSSSDRIVSLFAMDTEEDDDALIIGINNSSGTNYFLFRPKDGILEQLKFVGDRKAADPTKPFNKKILGTDQSDIFVLSFSQEGTRYAGVSIESYTTGGAKFMEPVSIASAASESELARLFTSSRVAVLWPAPKQAASAQTKSVGWISMWMVDNRYSYDKTPNCTANHSFAVFCIATDTTTNETVLLGSQDYKKVLPSTGGGDIHYHPIDMSLVYRRIGSQKDILVDKAGPQEQFDADIVPVTEL